MKMEYERYSERYRRNETNGNVGIISEDSAGRCRGTKGVGNRRDCAGTESGIAELL